MWTACPRVLDEEVKIFGLEKEDFVAVVVATLLSGVFLASWQSFLCGGLVGGGLCRSKRGRAPGALLHWLHRYELLPLTLSGVLSPRTTTSRPWYRDV